MVEKAPWGHIEWAHADLRVLIEEPEGGLACHLGIYFRDIARIPLLTAEQEVDLAKKLEAGEIAKMRLREDPPDDDLELAALDRHVEVGNGARTTRMESNLRRAVAGGMTVVLTVIPGCNLY